MTGFDYFKNCFVENYANFNGRARRKEYWYFLLFNNLIIYTLALISLVISLFSFLIIIYSLAAIIPNLAVTVRRLHDTGKSGWYILFNLIPIVGSILFFIALVSDSEKNRNMYGLNPKGNNDFEFETIHNQKI